MGAVSAGALSCLFCFSLFRSIFDSHRLAAVHKRLSGALTLTPLTRRELIALLSNASPDAFYRFLSRSGAESLANPFDPFVPGADRGCSWLRRITLSAVRVSTDGAIKEWLCQPRFKALPSPGRVLGRVREINPRTSAVIFGNKELAR